ncbi:M14 family metallopeptidase [Halalkalicoccus ordinarius]|uniref:hypothetical protein n=1 Tax=Halalkalicoccus ordinarius TaxID=3116651 RepID=UPI00300E7990
MNNKPTRRSVLTQIGLTTGIGVIGLPALSRSGAAHQVTRDHHTILENTLYETDVSTIAAPTEGPTVVVLAAFMGTNVVALRLLISLLSIRSSGTLVVIPETNKPAVKRDNNHGSNGDLNRQFPIGSEPMTMAARGIWDEVVDVDPDYLIDMHNATGIYGSDGIGQSIFPTANVVSAAESTVDYMNTTHLPDTDSLSAHDFHGRTSDLGTASASYS